jgi:hypothetical protein
VTKITWLTGLALALAALSPEKGHSMHIEKESHLIALSEDGKNRLLEVDESGPEGGGSLRYVIEGPGKDRSEALVSENFSHGSGVPPDSVSDALCRGEMERLQKELIARKFNGVTVNLENCAKRKETITVWYSMTTRDDPAWKTQGRPTLITVSGKEFERASKLDKKNDKRR